MPRFALWIWLVALAAGLAGCARWNDAAPSTATAAIKNSSQWHQRTPGSLDFIGPKVSETDTNNPFTDYRLSVTFTNGDREMAVRGFFAADGDAANSSADSGTIWRARFTPDRPGDWSYSAQLVSGPDVALHDRLRSTDRVIREWSGQFKVAETSAEAPLFHRSGLLRTDGHLLRWSGSGEYFLKGGANSPENLLGFADFDGTYRMKAKARDGESAVDDELHTFSPHLRDWREGDPIWQGEKGKGLIGAINYLSDAGMNAVYFLTMNVGGDGKDVWPWLDPEDPTRFDVSKLAQWEIVFDHMQRRGVALHIVLQETENELMLDGGDTGRLRQLYFQEMIARFAHHPALFWNLGEENGPVHWRPEGQNDAQRKAMAEFIAKHDPYRHSVLLHTHSEAEDKDRILTPLLGLQALDGLSFQVSEREQVNAETRKWNALSRKADQPWAITMDEIGKWHTGARHDRDDPTHDSLRRHALWGHLLGGGAGVEWYFGARQDGNDLTTEDWRSRAELWRQTAVALSFFGEHVPYWEMQPCKGAAYCLTRLGDLYVAYLSEATPALSPDDIDSGTYSAQFLNPMSGELSAAQTLAIMRGEALPSVLKQTQQDRVAILRRIRTNSERSK